MDATLELLFSQWNTRVNSTVNHSSNASEDLSGSQNTLDKNSQRLLGSILLTNRKYEKQEIPLSYSLNEETGEFENVDVIREITPFVTDKKKLFDNLEKERESFLGNLQKE